MTEIQQTTTSPELSAAVLGFFGDRSAFESWTATVSGRYVVSQHVAPKSEPLHIAAAYNLLGTAGLLVSGGANISVIDDLLGGANGECEHERERRVRDVVCTIVVKERVNSI